MKNKTRMASLVALLLIGLLVLTGCTSGQPANTGTQTTQQTAKFTPKLDTKASVSLEVGAFFGNFEALDQVINHFNEFYPNVTITYEQNSNAKLVEYMNNNQNVDIVMVDTSNVRYTNWDEYYICDRLLDLSAAGIDFSDVADGMLAKYTVDGKVMALPMSLKVYGLEVNQTLLEKEGLTVPQTWEEFLTVCEALKQKGYTPIQGPDTALFQEDLMKSLLLTMLGNDSTLLNALNKGEESAAQQVTVVFDRLKQLYEKGYISAEVNANYPDNNYEGSILSFFEGNVPFWVCDTEKASGMKKRESKSEAFTANPFTYTFVYAPTGDNGVSKYVETWYGFAINKGSEAKDYAVEFLRFMARQDELNTLASVKGVPSIAKVADDARYTSLSNVEKVDKVYYADGSLQTYLGTYLGTCAKEMITENLTPAEAAARYVQQCSEVYQQDHPGE